VAVTPIDHQGYAGPTLAVDPRDGRRLAIAYGALGRRSCFLALSSDGGRTWRNRTVGGDFSPFGPGRCYSPTAAYAADGTLYYAFVLPRDPGFGRAYLRIARPGRRLGPARALDTDLSPTHLRAGGADLDPALAAGRGGELWVAWNRYDSTYVHGKVQVIRSVDHGRRFTGPRSVNPPGRTVPVGQPRTAIDRAGTVYVNWVDETNVNPRTGGGRAAIELAHSTGRGGAFTTRTVATTPSGCGPPGSCGLGAPQTALATGAGRHVHVAWSAGPVDGRSRVFVSSSAGGGLPWSAPLGVLPPDTIDHDQFRPALSVAPNGRVDLDFYDRADTGRQDVYLASSFDFTQSFPALALLDTAPSDAQAAKLFSNAIALASSNGSASAAWNDDRRVNLVSNIDSVAGEHTDVYFARKAVP